MWPQKNPRTVGTTHSSRLLINNLTKTGCRPTILVTNTHYHVTWTERGEFKVTLDGKREVVGRNTSLRCEGSPAIAWLPPLTLLWTKWRVTSRNWPARWRIQQQEKGVQPPALSSSVSTRLPQISAFIEREIVLVQRIPGSNLVSETWYLHAFRGLSVPPSHCSFLPHLSESPYNAKLHANSVVN